MNETTEPKKPPYFCCYLDSETILQHLSDEQAGKLWKMLLIYASRDEKPDITDPVVSMAFDVMAQQIDRDFKKYQEKCDRNRANAYQRKRPLATATNGSQKKEKEKKEEEEKEKYIYHNMSTCVDVRNAFDYQSVVNSFNSICVSLPKVQKLTDMRKKKIKSLQHLLGDITIDEYFKKVESSDFLTGRTGNWNGCTFDWILKPANLTKIIEGNYDNKQQQRQDIPQYIQGVDYF